MIRTFQNEYDYLFKILLIGNSGVGKSSILLSFIENKFIESFLPTIGVDFKIKTLFLNNKNIKMQIWDTAGQERFKTITSSYYKGAHGIFLVYDISDRKSYEDIETFLNEIDNICNENVVKVIIGNKCDLENERSINSKEASIFAERNNVSFLECSAKNKININKIFEFMAENLVGVYQNIEKKKKKMNKDFGNSMLINSKMNKTTVYDGNEKNNNKNKCC